MRDINDQKNENEQQSIKLKLLIVEDDEGMEFLLSETVEDFSKELLIARNGIEAVEICKNNPDIDLVFMDVRMPLMNGYEATTEIRKFNKDVVIIAQTSFVASNEEKEKSIEAGCNDCYSKPITKVILEELIRKYF